MLIPWCLAVVARLPRRARRRRRDDVERRGVRGPPPRVRDAAGCAAVRAVARLGRAPGSRAARRERVVRRSFSRSGRPGPAAAPAACRDSGRRCGSSASAPPICWRSRRATGRSRSSSRPIASACATSSTCRRSWTRCRPSPAARSASSLPTPRHRRRSPRRCSSTTWPRSCTTAMRRWPSAARRRWRSITRSSGSCSATPSCASCSTPTCSTRSSGSSSRSTRIAARAAWTGCTTCCCVSAISRVRRSRRASSDASLIRAVDELDRRAPCHRAANRRCSSRLVAVEDAARYRDALGIQLPAGLPKALLEPVADPLGDLVHRFARTHGPFTTATCAARLGLPRPAVEAALATLAASGRVLQGEFRPGGREREWCGRDVLSTLRERSLARLRKQVEPVDARRAGPFRRYVAGCGAATRRPRRAARRRRAVAGRAGARVGAGARDPARTGRRLPARRPRPPRRGGRGRVGRPRAARRSRRAHRPVT